MHFNNMGKYTLLLILFLLPPALKAQNEALPIYTVQVGAFVDAQPADFDPVRSFGFLYNVPLATNLHRIYMGGYTQKQEADNIAALLQARGYFDAATSALDLSEGLTVYVIQLTTREFKDPINWSELVKAGPLYVLLNDKQVKIVTGAYPDFNAAKADLTRMRNMGFKEAFIKSVNQVLLHEVNSFITGALPVAPVAPATVIVPSEEIPTSFEVPVTIPPATTEQTPKAAANYPVIRSAIKRTSAIELQKVLKSDGSYTGSLDGYYGRGTAAAYSQSASQNAQLAKYSLLASRQEEGNESAFQKLLDNLPLDPARAMQGLAQSSQPLAKAYRAYQLFMTNGPGADVNNLMNTAVREGFSSSSLAGNVRFDYNASYAYNDPGQLVLHLMYVHAATYETATVPCWLMERHPAETRKAMSAESAVPVGFYRLQPCAGFLSWSEFRVLEAIARDLSAGQNVPAGSLAEAQSLLARYTAQSSPLSESDRAAALSWSARMIAGVDTWSGRDPMLSEIGKAFKLVYFQSQVLLEDHFMDKGLSYQQADGLAAATLRAYVGPYLERFL